MIEAGHSPEAGLLQFVLGILGAIQPTLEKRDVPLISRRDPPSGLPVGRCALRVAIK